MTIEQLDKIDFLGIDSNSGDVVLTISDHLSWDEEENEHLFLLQEKLNAYLRFIESGEMLEKRPDTLERSVVILIMGKFAMSERAESYFKKFRTVINAAGFELKFKLLQSH